MHTFRLCVPTDRLRIEGILSEMVNAAHYELVATAVDAKTCYSTIVRNRQRFETQIRNTRACSNKTFQMASYRLKRRKTSEKWMRCGSWDAEM